MVNETSGENLLEFSKMLDETFGPTEYNTEEILPSKVDPSREKSTQALTLGPSPNVSETEIEPRPEQKKVKINVSLPQEHSVKEHNRETSSDSITTKDSHIFDVTKDISDSKEDTTEAPLRNPGFIEMRLKRKSIMGLEEDDSDCLTNSQPVTEELHIETDNPSHLFWVPAHLHPEIAPNEFRKWLKNHAKDGFNSGIGSLRRRKSTLSKQYIPSDVEDEEEETTDKIVEPEKKWTGFDWESYIGSDGNINPTSESTKLNILRRSLSLNLPPFMGGSISNPNDPNIFDRHSSPDVDSKVLVPRMSPALKRAARTKIRRNSVAGEQNPRRFSAHRRTRSTHVSSDKEKQSENNIVSKRPKQKSESLSVPQITIDKVDKKLNSSEIVDEPEEIQKDIELECIDVKDGAGPIRITLKDEVATPEVISSSQITPALHKTSSLASDENELSSELQADQSDESNLLKVNTSELAKPGTFSTTTSPSTSPTSTSPISSTTPTSSTQSKRTSAWSWLWPGGSEEKLKDKEKDHEKDKEEKEPKPKKNKSDKSEKSEKSDRNENENNDSIVKEKDKEKDKEKSPKKSFSSIFSWPQNKGKSTDDSLTTTNTTTSLSQPIISNKKTKYTNYNRLPIHVERAIYRLSHVKLANPRRPLHEQVLISNMMFWYLSLINKQQVEHGGGGNPNAEIAAHKVKSKVGKEKTSRKRKKAEKKSGLTRKGAGPGSSAEIAYKAPQYDMNQISQQYMTPPTSTNEFEEETVEDFGDNIDYHGEDEIQAHGYHHYNDEYLSDGTDGGYLDETNGRIESSHSGGLLHSSAEFDDNIGESSSGIKNNNYVRSPSPNGRPTSPNGRSKSSTGRSKSPTGRPPSPNKKSGSPTPQRNSVPPSSKRKFINIPRNRSSSAGTRPLNPHNKISSKISTINSTADDEDDDVPLGLYKISSNTK